MRTRMLLIHCLILSAPPATFRLIVLYSVLYAKTLHCLLQRQAQPANQGTYQAVVSICVVLCDDNTNPVYLFYRIVGDALC